MGKIIAIVEDDPDQLGNYTDALSRYGYQVNGYQSRADALRAFDQRLPDLAILDIMLGNETDAGFDLCRELQARNSQLPIIFLTSRSDEIDRISGLRLGACDYQTKPVSLAFLGERVQALFRLIENRNLTPDHRKQLGELTIDDNNIGIYWMGRPVACTYTEFNIIKSLVDHIATRGASYDELSNMTRQGIVESNTINTHILHLRKKFRQIDPDFNCIKSVYGFGYRWACS